ncbi:unnamed protein product [Brassica rapa subsp. trilocularis]
MKDPLTSLYFLQSHFQLRALPSCLCEFAFSRVNLTFHIRRYTGNTSNQSICFS